MNKSIGYALLCIVVPMAWGLAVMLLSEWFTNWRKKKDAKNPSGESE